MDARVQMCIVHRVECRIVCSMPYYHYLLLQLYHGAVHNLKQSKQPKEEKSKEIVERPQDILKPVKQIIRQPSEKTIQRLEPIQERTP